MMDEQGIDVEALSINPFWYAAERDLARQIIQLQNEKLAALCAAYPDRFVAFATVALQHPDLAAQQLEDGKKLGLRGAAIGGNVNGEELSSRRLDPFWAKAEELGAPIFIHPQGDPGITKTFPGQRLFKQRNRQSTGNHHGAVSSDFRWHARPVPRSQDLRGARWRIPAVLFRADPIMAARHPRPIALQRR